MPLARLSGVRHRSKVKGSDPVDEELPFTPRQGVLPEALQYAPREAC